jgi:antibiotic biosynthesis monooxygenase (ABM) superfamily enzyme
LSADNPPEAPRSQSAPAAPAPASGAHPLPPALPSIHVRAFITWLAIFPLVAVLLMVLGPLLEPFHPIWRSFILTAIVVPVAVYFVVPKLFAGYGKLVKRKALRRAARKG